MPKPFEKLGEILGISPIKNSIGDSAFPFKAQSWEDVINSTKPLKEKNFHFMLSPKPAKFFNDMPWPPSSLEVRLDLTSEYVEGIRTGIDKKLLHRLKEGKFSIQATLNIRGLTAEEARLVIEDFIKRALHLGYSCVLIIHGRGLSSKGEPVLKTLVRDWLRRGPYRKYILAYASARPCDGGLGATYVLLSQRPLKG